VPHLCQFGLRKSQAQESPNNTSRYDACEHVFGSTNSYEKSVARGQKRSHGDSQTTGTFHEELAEKEKVEEGLKAWGYMPGHVHYKLGDLETEVCIS
jgi:hypothetical protein